MQTRWWSFLESLTNTVVSFVQGFLTQLVVFPIFGIYVSHGTNAIIVGIFLAVSFVRTFAVRRFFNWWATT